MNVHIREATSADLEHILHHRRQMFQEMGGAYREAAEQILIAAREYLEKALPTGAYKGWLVETEAGEIVAGGGLVISDWPGFLGGAQPRRAWILNVYTEPAWRRAGIARRLIATILEWCRAEDLGAVSLHASAEARPLYESFGFVPTNEMRLKL